jgi:hypothetical protein
MLSYILKNHKIPLVNYIMSKLTYITPHSPEGSMYFKVIPFFFFLFFLMQGQNISFAASDVSLNNFQLTYENKLLSITAADADLKSILQVISKKANIYIEYPASLDNRITIKLTKLSLKKALQRLLKDYNYSIVYSGTRKRSAVSEVYILKKNMRSPQATRNDTRIISRIQSYEKRIESLKNNLSKVGENSTSGKRYLSQIKSYEKNIENLKRQLE